MNDLPCRANEPEGLTGGPNAFLCQYDLNPNIKSFPERYSTLYQEYPLTLNEYLVSENGIYKLLLSNDKNLVLYVK